MNLLPLPTGAYEEMCYVVWGDEKQAIVIDPGFDAERIHAAIREQDLSIAAYVMTHGHYDHINALADLYDREPAPIAMHAKDLAWAFTERNQKPPYYPVPRKPATDDVLDLAEHDDWTFGGLRFQRLETPGHTPGGCSLLFSASNTLFCGDTLFKGSCGRTDLPGGDARQLRFSLNILKQLPEETRVFPGHGEDTTIGRERVANFHLR